jgi:hypothetical protein
VPVVPGSKDREQFVKWLRGNPKPSVRDLALFGLSAETQDLILKTIELNPALEDSILKIADLAYADGADSVQ